MVLLEAFAAQDGGGARASAPRRVVSDLSKFRFSIDRGGTSTDVSRFGDDYELAFETETAGVRIQAPQLHIKTVAAGSRAALQEMAKRVNDCYHAKGLPALTIEEVALGFVQVANETMARAIREISVARGFDLKSHVLATFGGAGPQHACAIARALGIAEIFIHRHAGILSVYGMGLADVVVDRQKPSSRIYARQILDQIDVELDRLYEQACRELSDLGGDHDRIDGTRYLNLRYDGTDTAIMIPRPADNDYARVLRDTYLREFGFDLSDRAIHIDDIRVRVAGKSAGLQKVPIARALGAATNVDTVSCYFEGRRSGPRRRAGLESSGGRWKPSARHHRHHK